MAYADDEESQASGAPVEVYEFIGSATTWRYASGNVDAVVDGDTYTALAGLARSSISIGTTRDTPTLTVHLPTSAPLVGQYCFATPPRSLRLRLLRMQSVSGEWRVEWDGEVASIKAKGMMAEASSPSNLAARLSTNVPGLTLRVYCLHFLYDARCRVVAATYDHATTVASVSSDGFTVTVSGVGAHPDNWFKAGEIVRDSDGERRSIVAQVGAVLTLASPFRTIANPNPVTMYAGCDHLFATCRSKFGNSPNFGGMPVMPQRNPFRNPIRLGDS